MVKRKRVGSCSVQDEKRQDEGMTLHVQREGIKSSDQKQLAQEPCTSQQVNTSRGRSQHHVSRTTGTQNQPANDSSHQEEGMTSLEKQPSKCVIAQRSSIRISKRPRKDTSPPVVQPASKKPAAKQSTPPDQSKTRRSWELWSVEDKNAFFEALCEYGKDFESIQSYIAQRSKKKGIPPNMIKNKDQVRHFYYRTWHKISKHLNIGEDVKKQTQELYGLINYAELRKKIGGCLNEKNRQKLNELVFNGVTIVKYRGKKLRIKTPVCRALKKLNNIADTKEPEVQKLPKEILVEFRPQSNAAWLHVQNLAQNPRVRTKLCLQKRLKTVIDYLQKRWQPLRLKRKEQILTSLPSSAVPPLPPDPCPLLRVRPKRDATFSLLSISAVDVASSTDVCLENYLKNTLKECKEKENIKSKKGATRTKNKTAPVEIKAVLGSSESHSKTIDDKVVKSLHSLPEEQHNKEEKSSQIIDSAVALLTPPKSVPEQLDVGENPVDEAQRSLSMLTDMLNSMDDKSHTQQGTNYKSVENEKNITEQQNKVQSPLTPECRTIEELYLNTQPNVDHMTLGQLLGLATEKNQSSNEDVTEIDSDKTIAVLPSFVTTPEEIHKSDRTDKITEPSGKEDMRKEIENGRLAVRNEMEKLQKGWTVCDVGILTVGELYLKLGCPEKIVLEYDWEQPEDHKTSEACSMNAHLVDKTPERGQLQKLAEVLRKLVQVASSTFADFKNKQQIPVSPTHRTGGHSRTSTTSPSGKSSTSRGSNRSPSVRAGNRVTSGSTSKSKAVDKNTACKEAASNSSQVSSETAVHTPPTTLSGNAPIDSSNITGEKHVFVVPVGTAPRTVKQPSAESVREQLDKLIPASRRGGRTRRKPLVVQRPLLPREGMGTVAGPRPMAVVHLVPSSSQLSPLAAVIPSGSTTSTTVSKVALPQAKKVVKIVPTGAPIDVRPIQVPLLKPVDSSGNASVVLPTTNLSTAHLVMATSSVASPLAAVQTPEPEVMSTPSLVVPAITAGSSLLQQVKGDSEQSVLIQRTTEQALSTPSVPVIVNASSPPQVEALPLSVLSSSSKATTLSTICITTTCTSSPPQISIPETAPSGTSTISPPSITSLLEMSLVEGTYLPSEAMPDHASEPLLDFNESSNSSLSGVFGLASPLSSNKMASRDASVSIPTCLSSDPVVAPRHSTPPNSPPSSHFRISSPGPEGQWLNGESADFSLSSLLNTLESPSKTVPVSSSSSNLTTDNSNLTSIVRLAPDVDSQLQCLMNESSVDYVAKFADLAAQITSSATDSKPA